MKSYTEKEIKEKSNPVPSFDSLRKLRHRYRPIPNIRGAKHLWVGYKWRPTYHMSTYLDVINQVNKLLKKMYSNLPILTNICFRLKYRIWDSLEQWFSNFGIHQNHLKGLLQQSLWAPSPDSLIREVWDRASKAIFLTWSQVMLLLVWDYTLKTLL